jgi:predicted transcriptional regulator
MTKGYMTIRLDAPLKRKVAEMAKKEQRRFNDQVIFLMLKGLSALEQTNTPQQPQPVSEGAA